MGGEASTNWIVDNLNSALDTWNGRLTELWQLLTQDPATFKGGGIWSVMLGINGALKAVGYGLLVLFFAAGVVKTCGSLTELKRPEAAVSFWDSIPLWAVTLLGSLFITVLSFLMILTVYGRMFKLFLYAAIAPIPLATFAGEPSSSVGKNFLRSYAGVCLEGLVIALSCVIFSAMASSPPAVDPNASAVTAVWTYVAELIFNFLVLVGSIKMSDQVVKELMGL